jgi:hypothetical protein
VNAGESDTQNGATSRTPKSRAWYYANRDRQRDLRRRQKYGLTRDDYLAMVENQAGLCAICNREFGDKLRVDHDHETKKLRGLLCSSCNAGLGYFQDKASVLEGAVCYLASSGCLHEVPSTLVNEEIR